MAEEPVGKNKLQSKGATARRGQVSKKLSRAKAPKPTEKTPATAPIPTPTGSKKLAKKQTGAKKIAAEKRVADTPIELAVKDEEQLERGTLRQQVIDAANIAERLDDRPTLLKFIGCIPPDSSLGQRITRETGMSHWPTAARDGGDASERLLHQIQAVLRRMPPADLFRLALSMASRAQLAARPVLRHVENTRVLRERLQRMDARIRALFGTPLFREPIERVPLAEEPSLALAMAEQFATGVSVFRRRRFRPLVSPSISPLSMEWRQDSPGIKATDTRERERSDPRRSPAEPCSATGHTSAADNANERAPRYSFPNTLKEREDLFYDFSVIVPLASRAPLDDRLMCFWKNHSLIALASQALTIKGRLDAEQLTTVVLGSELASAITSIANEASNIAQTGGKDVAAQACLRLRLRETAAAIRTVERAWILGLHTGASPLATLGEQRNSLEGAVKRLAPFGDKSAAVPAFYTGTDAYQKGASAVGTVPPARDHNPDPAYQAADAAFYRGDHFTGDNPARTQALTFNGVEPPASNDFYWAKQNPWSANDSLRGWYYADTRAVQDKLTAYVAALGSSYPSIVDVRAAITGVIAWLNSLEGAGPSDAKRLQFLIELIAQALQALGTLFEQMAETVSIPQYPPNSMRLGFQVIYRQHWVPTGYIKGKLVGYRTLLPGESQSIKRRTFVKTSSERSSTDTFSSSREENYSRTQRETSELLSEQSSKFGFEVNASGHVNFGVAGAELKTSANGTLSDLLRGTRNSLSELVTKGSASYNNKREIKIREMVEEETGEETTIQIQNLNQEITANYFYYQLLREYNTLVELHDLRPVLMVAREHPTPAAIDEKFVCRYIHVLFSVLPPQLAADADRACEDIVPARRRMLRARNAASYARGEYEVTRDTLSPTPDDAQRQRLTDAREAATKARQEYYDAETVYERLSTTVERVVTFVRENLLLCMHRIWQSTSQIDREAELRDLTYNRQPLDQITQGLRRVGFLAGEELYEYTGADLELVDEMLGFLSHGTDIINNATLKSAIVDRIMAEQGVDRPSAEAQLGQYVFLHEDEIYDLTLGVVKPPAADALAPQIDRVQIAQDALVVEAMPGSIPLLEGFKLAHRALDVEKACLENEHLRQRIKAEPWEKGSDRYEVLRVEGVEPGDTVGAAAVLKKASP